jgi:ribosomal protein L11 methyltransferase
MAQTRIYMTGAQAELKRVHRYLEAEFEDDGYPLDFNEINEDDDLFQVSVYVFQGEENEAEARIRNRVGADAFGLTIAREVMPDIDWVAHSLEGLAPVRVGRVVVHGSHDRSVVRTGDIGIEIEAAQAFGTGHHGTTAGCIAMLQKILKKRAPQNMLDLGTGSAVLALALAKLTNRKVLATDNDALAVEIAHQNAALNGCAHLIEFAVAEGFNAPAIRHHAPYDLIVANILARPLMQLAPDMAAATISGADLVLSGILDRQSKQVVAAYVTNGFAFQQRTSLEGWVTLHFKRK